MPSDRTVPHARTGFPVRTLRASVVEGPDAGASCVAPADTLTVGTARGNDLVLGDPTVSRFHAELWRAATGVCVVDHGSTNGTFVGPVRVERAVVPPGTVLRVGQTLVSVGEGETVAVAIHKGEELAGLRGRTPVMRRLMAEVRTAAQADVAVLVVGETGTGKELVARALHEIGPRAKGPFVTVDCGALLPTLVASELFGHERGAFTGADRQRSGAFEEAAGGTLFLDEIGELPTDLQPTLLGALERRRIRRVGGRTDLPTDVRVVCATNRDLRGEVNAGRFRLDLYYRVAVVVLRLPPLRDRPDDVPLLVEHFLRRCGHEGPIEALVPAEAMEAMRAHRWPGNVRELRNLVEATVAMGRAPALEEPPRSDRASSHAPPGSSGPASSRATPLDATYRDARATVLADFERRYLRRRLDRAGGNVSRAAREADMDRSHLIEMLRRHGMR